MLKMGSRLTEKKLEVMLVALLALCFFSSAVYVPQDSFTSGAVKTFVLSAIKETLKVCVGE